MTSLLQIVQGNRVLGISLGERSLQVAEVNADGKTATELRAVEFPYPPGMTLADGPGLGAALAQFLKDRNFTARRVLFGVPAKWLIIKPHTLPPADAETAADMLYLHVTEEIPSDLGPMVFDFLGESNAEESSAVLLVGIQRRWIDCLSELARAARLKIAAITPVGLALGQATWRQVRNSLILFVRPDGVELLKQDGPQTRSLRHVGSSGAIGPLVVELRRSAAIDAQASSEVPILERRGLVVWDEVGLDEAFLESLRSSAAMEMQLASPKWIDASLAGSQEPGRWISAAALTMPIRGGKRPVIDFHHSRLAKRRRAPLHRRVSWLTGTAAVIAIAVMAAIGDTIHLQHQIANTDEQLQKLQPALTRATPFVNGMQFVESFRGGNPKFVACLRDVVAALPSDGQTYLVNFNLDSEMHGEVNGRAAGNQNVVNLVDKLRSDGKFDALNCRLDPPATRSGGNAGAGAGAPAAGGPAAGGPAAGGPAAGGPAGGAAVPAGMAMGGPMPGGGAVPAGMAMGAPMPGGGPVVGSPMPAGPGGPPGGGGAAAGGGNSDSSFSLSFIYRPLK